MQSSLRTTSFQGTRVSFRELCLCTLFLGGCRDTYGRLAATHLIGNPFHGKSRKDRGKDKSAWDNYPFGNQGTVEDDLGETCLLLGGTFKFCKKFLHTINSYPDPYSLWNQVSILSWESTGAPQYPTTNEIWPYDGFINHHHPVWLTTFSPQILGFYF